MTRCVYKKERGGVFIYEKGFPQVHIAPKREKFGSMPLKFCFLIFRFFFFNLTDMVALEGYDTGVNPTSLFISIKLIFIC
jgi:hypothetical protein